MTATTKATAMPDGLADAAPARHRTVNKITLATLVLAALFALALTGLLGGGPPRAATAQVPQAVLRIDYPEPVRNGMIIEWRITVEARAPIANAAIAIPAQLWREVTINSLVPAAEKELFRGGAYVFEFGPLAPGDHLEFKIDGQVNPGRFGSHESRLRLLDGKREIAAVPMSMKVLP
jgi:hypothetical protein